MAPCRRDFAYLSKDILDCKKIVAFAQEFGGPAYIGATFRCSARGFDLAGKTACGAPQYSGLRPEMANIPMRAQ
jgi:hypothetical protein